MSTFDEQMDAVTNPSLNYGTGFLTGQRAGTFQSKDGTVNRGVWVGNAKPTVWNLVNPQYAYAPANAISVPTSGFLPLGIYQQQQFVVPNFGIVLDAPRTLLFFGDQPYKATYSGYNQWGQKQTETLTGVLTGGVYYVGSLMGVKALTSVYIETEVPNMIGFQATQTIELPYTDNGNGASLVQVILENQPCMWVPPDASPPYYGNWNFRYFPASTTTNAQVRPTIQLNGGDTGASYTDNSILSVIQAVDNVGFTFDSNFLNLENPYPNDYEKVIGMQPNSNNWTGWQG